MTFGAARQALHHREPAGSRRQYRHRGSRAGGSDGYTLLVATDSNATNATLYNKLNFNFIRDIAPVSGMIRAPFVMVVKPSFPATTVPEFIAYAKANPGKISMASGGVGSGNPLSGELFKIMAGINMIHVPYRGERMVSAVAKLLIISKRYELSLGAIPNSVPNRVQIVSMVPWAIRCEDTRTTRTG